VIARRAGVAEVSDEFVQRADVRALMRKVRITVDPKADPVGPTMRRATASLSRLAMAGGSSAPSTFRAATRAAGRPEVLWRNSPIACAARWRPPRRGTSSSGCRRSTAWRACRPAADRGRRAGLAE